MIEYLYITLFLCFDVSELSSFPAVVNLLIWTWIACSSSSSIGLVVSGAASPGQLYSSLAQIEALFTFDKLVGEVLVHLPEHLPAANRCVYCTVRGMCIVLF